MTILIQVRVNNASDAIFFETRRSEKIQ